VSLPLTLVAMASGGGRTVLNVLGHIERGDLCDVVLRHVFVSRKDAPAIERCRAAGLHVHLPDDDIDAAAQQFLLDTNPDMVLLCGYLRHLHIPPRLTDRVLNIHPSLLPDFGGRGMYGQRVHEAVLEARRTDTGCTVHLVDDTYDSGPIVLQRTCPVRPDDTPDTLAARVFEMECDALPDAIALATQGRLRRSAGRVDVAPSNSPWPDGLFRRP